MVYRYPLGNSLHPEALTEKQRALREGFQTPLAFRVHRALSWLRRAEAEDQDHDVRFILLWIGFNAAYAGDVEASASSPAPEGERGLFQAFFSTLVKFDARHRVYNSVWQRFSQEIRLLMRPAVSSVRCNLSILKLPTSKRGVSRSCRWLGLVCSA